MASFLGALSALFGWVYTICWSASFYPQPLLSWRRRSTSGTTVDYPLINSLGKSPLSPPSPGGKWSLTGSLGDRLLLGFASYLASNLAFYYSATVRAQYAARHRGLTPTVQFNDVTFALHALLLSLLTTSQYLAGARAWGFAPAAAGRQPSRFILGVAAGSVLGVLLSFMLVAGARSEGREADPRTDWCELDVVYALGYVKLVITLVKYTPQLVANWRNKSTVGWSIWQVLLDVAGGVLSVSQQGIDSYRQGDWSGISGNPVKFALGNVSMAYDTLFILQHYVVYRRGGEGRSGEEDRLLPDEERRID
ncbi:hypothetical protein S40285_04271 [Stachybotrys chlorohalonatus IBT 40285]|uniref:Cystinosin n=1 Tax=Stachybotrys chlorohalonatus (strain IBT 40285) TaxID=1283841 RepID=A0A084QUA8_STAC4|nr:hypothetical protein S40285_04271 [Stachybotrys chlorohalonata IBT 40285]